MDKGEMCRDGDDGGLARKIVMKVILEAESKVRDIGKSITKRNKKSINNVDSLNRTTNHSSHQYQPIESLANTLTTTIRHLSPKCPDVARSKIYLDLSQPRNNKSIPVIGSHGKSNGETGKENLWKDKKKGIGVLSSSGSVRQS